MVQSPWDELIREVERELGATGIQLLKADTGVSGRTFFVRHNERSWILRVEDGEALQLRRAVAAQEMAKDAGVSVPAIVAHNLGTPQSHGTRWAVEEHVKGDACENPDLETSKALGAQLRRLHSVPAPSYGLMPPNPYPTYPSRRALLERGVSSIEKALAYCEADPAWEAPIRDAYAFLMDVPEEPPCLCHGDCAGQNIRTSDSRVVALIDWEWANGGDPTANIAYWAFWNENDSPLDALLDGYQPRDLAAFRQRVEAYWAVTAIRTIYSYSGLNDREGISYCRNRMERRFNDGRLGPC